MPDIQELRALCNSRKIEKAMTRDCPVFLDHFKIRFDGVEDRETLIRWLHNGLTKHGMCLSPSKVNGPPQYQFSRKILAAHGEYNVCGKISYSDDRPRVLLELSGKGCAMVEHRNQEYSWLAALSGQPNTHICRIDLTYDDMQGRYPLEKVDRDYSRGRFNSVTGSKPKKHNMGNKNGGRTRYIGGKTAYKRACTYEKAKQLGLRSEEYSRWLRFEVRFISNGRDKIPSEIVSRRRDYFYSAYPKVTKNLLDNASYLPVAKRRAIEYQATLSSKLSHARHSYGRIVGAGRAQLQDKELLDIICRPGTVKGLARLPIFGEKELLEYKAILLQPFRGENEDSNNID